MEEEKKGEGQGSKQLSTDRCYNGLLTVATINDRNDCWEKNFSSDRYLIVPVTITDHTVPIT